MTIYLILKCRVKIDDDNKNHIAMLKEQLMDDPIGAHFYATSYEVEK
jgi:hypothetical protein